MATIDLTLSDDSDLELIDRHRSQKKPAQHSQFKSNALGSTANAFSTPFSAASKKHPASSAFEPAAYAKPNANHDPLADSYHPQSSRYEPAGAPFQQQESNARKTGSNSIPLGPRPVTSFNPAAASFAPQPAYYDALGHPGYGAAPPSFLPQSMSYGPLGQDGHGSGPNPGLPQFANYAAHGHPGYGLLYPPSIQPTNHQGFGDPVYKAVPPDQLMKSIESDAPGPSSSFNQARYDSNVQNKRARFPNLPTEQLPANLPLLNPAIYVAQQVAPADSFVSNNPPTWRWDRARYPFPQPGPLPQPEQLAITRRPQNLAPAQNWYTNDSIVGQEFDGPGCSAADELPTSIKESKGYQDMKAPWNNDLEYQALVHYLGPTIANLEMSKPVGEEPHVTSSFNQSPVNKAVLADIPSGKKQAHELESPERDESEEKSRRGAWNAGASVVRFEDLESPDKEDFGGGGEYSFQPRRSLPRQERDPQIQGSNTSSEYQAYNQGFDNISVGAPRPQDAYYTFNSHPAGVQVPKIQQAQLDQNPNPHAHAATPQSHSHVPPPLPPPTQQPPLQHHLQQHSDDQSYKNPDVINIDSDSEDEARLLRPPKRRRLDQDQEQPRSTAQSDTSGSIRGLGMNYYHSSSSEVTPLPFHLSGGDNLMVENSYCGNPVDAGPRPVHNDGGRGRGGREGGAFVDMRMNAYHNNNPFFEAGTQPLAFPSHHHGRGDHSRGGRGGGTFRGMGTNSYAPNSSTRAPLPFSRSFPAHRLGRGRGGGSSRGTRGGMSTTSYAPNSFTATPRPRVFPPHHHARGDHFRGAHGGMGTNSYAPDSFTATPLPLSHAFPAHHPSRGGHSRGMGTNAYHHHRHHHHHNSAAFATFPPPPTYHYQGQGNNTFFPSMSHHPSNHYTAAPHPLAFPTHHSTSTSTSTSGGMDMDMNTNMNMNPYPHHPYHHLPPAPPAGAPNPDYAGVEGRAPGIYPESQMMMMMNHETFAVEDLHPGYEWKKC